MVIGVIGGISPAARAAPVLTIEPITWNVVGLDSNDVFDGPSRFMVGARVCNTGTDPATNVVATFTWDSSNSFINLVGDSTLTVETLAPGACSDFYFEIAITRTTAAYDTTRDYHISVTADGLGSVSTPMGREIYVERLVSQNRNSVEAITGPGGRGDPPATTVFVGETYTYKLFSNTATGGYEQLESFINFSNVVFQVLSVSSTYTAPPGGTNDKFYADACGWENDPADPDYRSCVGPENYPGGKAGGTIETTYVVRILSPGTTVISALIYDFSGSSYHYNSDFGGFPLNAILVTAVEPADLSLSKSHAGDFTVGAQGTYQLSVTNNGGVSAPGPITITDTLPAGLTFVSGAGTGWTCSAVGQDVTCTRAAGLGAGASSSVSLVVDVGPSAAPQVTNSATVSFNGTDQTPANNTASDLTNVIPSADLSISKSHTGEMVVGLPFTFDIQVSNAGPSTSSGPITMTDTLPAGLTYLSFSGADWNCSAVGQDVTCTHAGALAAAASSALALIVDVDGAAFPSVTNTAVVVPTTSDPDSSNNSDSDIVGIAGAANLALSKSHSGNFVAGEQGTYEFTVSNGGTGAATGPVVVTDSLPAGLSFVSGSGAGWSCTAVGQDVVCTHPADLAAAASSSFSVTVDVASDAPASVTNIAAASSDSPDADPSDNTDQDETSIDRVADLAITKTHAGSFVVGTEETYDLEVANAGPSDAEGPITVSDTLPAGLTYDSFSGSGWSCSAVGQDVTCIHAADLAAGASTTVLLNVDVSLAAAPAITNVASVGSETADPDGANNSDQDATDVLHVDLSVAKSHTGNFVAGQQGAYDIAVSNLGTADATGPVVVTDSLPAGLSFVSGSGTGWSCSAVDQDVTCTHAGGLAAGASSSFSLIVDVASDASGSVTNEVSVFSASPDATPGNDSDQDPTTIDQSADLSISKSHSSAFVVGTQGVYDISVSNAGPSDAAGPITVSDTLPSGLTYNSFAGAGWSCSAVGQDVTCTHAGDLAEGDSSSFSITVDVGPAAAPSVTNSASVESPTPDPDEANNAGADPTQVDQLADLSIIKTASGDPFFIGAIRTFTLTVSNAGPSPATGIQVIDVLPPELSFVSATPSQGSCGELAGVVICSLGTLASGETATVALVVSPTAAGDVDNTAEVTSEVDDPDPLNNEDTETVTVQDPPPPIQADLAITKSHSGSFSVGTPGTYDIVVSNEGPTEAEGPITVSDTLPAGLTYDSFSGSGWSCSAVSQDVTCTHAGNLSAGTNTTVSVTVSVEAAAVPSVTNTASVDSSTADPDDTNNSDQDVTQVTEVDLSVSKSHSGNFVAGEQGQYDLNVSNLGTADATGPVVVTDSLPAGLSFVSGSGTGWSCSAIGPGVTCTHAADLAAGESSALTLIVDVASDAPASVTNQASVSSQSADMNPSNDSDQDGATIDREADLSIAKSHTGSFRVGTQGTYDFSVSNAGPSDAEGPITVSDTLPDGLPFVSGSGTGWSCSAVDQDVTCIHAGDLPAGDSSSFSITVGVGPAAAPSVTNSASVDSPTPDPDDANNTDQDATDVGPSAENSVTNDASPDPVQIGSPFTYTITVSNAGPSPAADVQVADTLPSALSFVSADPSQGSCAEVAGVVVCSLGTIAAGNSATISLQVSPTAAGAVSNTVEVLSSVHDPDPSNNDDTEGVIVQAAPPVPQADLILAKSHAGSLSPGATATYIIEVSNAGPDVAEGPIVVIDELPSGLTFVSASGTGWSCSAAGNIVTCQRDADLAMNATTTLNLVVRLDAGLSSDVENAASVSSATADPDVLNNDDNDVAALDDPGAPADDDSPPRRAPSRRLAYTGFGFDRMGSIAVGLLAFGALMMVLAVFLRRSKQRPASASGARSSGRAKHHDLDDKWSATPPATQTLGLTPRRASRLGMATLVAGLLIVGHLGWMLWGSGLGTARAQEQLRDDFAASNDVNRHGVRRSVAIGSPIGVIRIPRLEVDMMVVEGTGSEQLQKGPGHYRDTAMPWDPSGRVGIAGHRTTYLQPFLSLDKLRAGDAIVLETKRGTFRYEVRSSREVEPSDVSVLRQTRRPSLALTTCSPLYSAEKRLVVIADLVSVDLGR